MTKARLAAASAVKPERWYRGNEIPRAAIRRFVRAVAERFQPDKIILFGSHAYGTPNADSDVDILVIMPTRNRRKAVVDIRLGIPVRFAMDLMVWTPKAVQSRVALGDPFFGKVLSRGTILYEKIYPRMGKKGRSRSSRLPAASAHAAASS